MEVVSLFKRIEGKSDRPTTDRQTDSQTDRLWWQTPSLIYFSPLSLPSELSHLLPQTRAMVVHNQTRTVLSGRNSGSTESTVVTLAGLATLCSGGEPLLEFVLRMIPAATYLRATRYSSLQLVYFEYVQVILVARVSRGGECTRSWTRCESQFVGGAWAGGRFWQVVLLIQ